MTEYLNIGPTPAEEGCAQMGVDPNYDSISRRECTVYLRMLERLFPIADECPASLVIKSFAHDGGRYREVCVRYDPNDESATSYAFQVEGNTPAQWDAIALAELQWYQEREHYWAQVQAGRLHAEAVPPEFHPRHPPNPSAEALELNSVPRVGLLRQRILEAQAKGAASS